MNKLNEICILYNASSVYVTCYFKEFFKWIGVSYVGCELPMDLETFLRFEKNQFAVVLDIGGILENNERANISQLSKERKIRTVSLLEKKPVELLRFFWREVKNVYLDEAQNELMQELITIYEANHLVSYLYDYTMLLASQFGEDISESLYNVLKETIGELESVILKYSQRQEAGVQYAVYAKFNCQKILDELLYDQGEALEYRVESYLSEIMEIYRYDPTFFKVEYLKAKVTDFDSLYRPLGKTYLEACIQGCQSDVCKSYQYYALEKWLEADGQPSQAEKIYRLAFKKNPVNVKAIFKLAIYELNRGELELAEMLLKQLSKRWQLETELSQVLPRDLEYAYKVNRLLGENEKLSKKHIEAADLILGCIRAIGKENGMIPNKFIEQLYPNSKMRVEICRAMLQRLDPRCTMN